MRNLLYIIIDSARFDTFAEAQTPNMRNLGKPERRFSYAGWTSPSHFVYLMGLTPHLNPMGVFASEVYKNDYKQWASRLKIQGLTMKDFVPSFSLPKFLKSHGYKTAAMVSMPIINQHTILSAHFDSYELMPRYDDFGAMIEKIHFQPSAPSFYFLNLGEAHYPYMIPPGELPPITGEKGVIIRQGDPNPGADPTEYYFNLKHLKYFRERQVAAIAHLDKLIGRLLQKCPKDTYVIITSDHGELFGEAGFFGHGPIVHEKVFEVPYLEGCL